MAFIYRPTQTKHVPPGADIFTRKGERFARWKDGKGKTKTAKVVTTKTGEDRLLMESPYWRCRYRDGSGAMRDVPTGCKDQVAAESFKNELVRRAELVKANVMTAADDAASDHSKVPLTEHIAAYLDHLRAKGVTDTRHDHVDSWLGRLVADCGFSFLSDLRAEPVEKWLVLREAEDMSAATRNAYLKAAIAFTNWCVNTNRLIANPLTRVPKADEKADPRHQRRALTQEELEKLIAVAAERPLLDKMTVRRGKRKGQRIAELSDATHRKLELVGQERALIYKTLVLTGLRKGELASITVGNLDLDAGVPYIVLDAGSEKNRQGSEIPLRSDLAADIRVWLADKLATIQTRARENGEPIPVRLPPSTPFFNVPAGLHRILDRDLVFAGIAHHVVDEKTGKARIAKEDDRGRTIDVHALRTTFGTHLSKGGVALRTAQAAMRHSTPNLTANVYTDPKLLDVRGALDVLPSLPLDRKSDQETARATGTDDAAYKKVADAIASLIALNSGQTGASKSKADQKTNFGPRRVKNGGLRVSGVSVNRNGSQSPSDPGSSHLGQEGLK